MTQHTTPPPEKQTARLVARPTRLGFLTSSPIFESLQIRDFRWMWLGSLGSFLAMNMLMITQAWLVLRLADDSPLALSIVIISMAAPMTFVSAIGGALADRVPKKRMVILSQGGSVGVVLLLATLDLKGLVDFWHVVVLGVASGSAMAFNMPSRQAMISEMVPESKLMNAISLSNSGMNLTRVVGPAVAGVLIKYIGTAGVFYLIAGMYMFSALSMAMVRAGGTAVSRSRKGMTGDIREGFAHAAGDRTLRGLIIMALIPVLFGFSYHALMPAWGREALDVQSEDLGVLMMVMGIGALIGTLILGSIRNLKRRGAFLLASCVVWGVSLAVFSQMTSYAAAVPFLLFIGLVSSVFMSLNMTLMQLHAAPEMRGRIMSISMMTWGAMPLSAVPFGALAERIGTPDALSLSGVLLAAFTLVFAVVYPSFRKIP